MTDELLVTLETTDQAHALVRDVVADQERVIACACGDVEAFMRDAVGFPHEGVPEAHEWPELTQRTGLFMTAPGRVLMRSIDTPRPVDELVGELLSSTQDVPLTDVLVMPETTLAWGDHARERTIELAASRGVQIHVGR